MEAPKTVRKIAFVGKVAVGKTSLIRYLSTGSCDLGEYQPTIGVSGAAMAAPAGDALSIDLLDTAGEERYSALIPIYLRTANAVAICFDPSDPEWLAGLTQSLAVVRETDPATPVAAVATKSDTWPDGTEEHFRREIQRFGFPPVCATSVMTGAGIDAAKSALVALAAEEKAAEPMLGVELAAPSAGKSAPCGCAAGGASVA